MLERLTVKNYAIIDKAEINFKEGFNVLTGETGAGKSIIIGALNLILGGKSSLDAIKGGANKIETEAIFVTENSFIEKILSDWGIEYESGEPVIIRREVYRDGRNRCFINTYSVPVSRLKELGDMLVDIHGQHEHQSLLKVNTHIELVDSFGKLDEERELMANLYYKYTELKSKLNELLKSKEEKEKREEYLKFVINEIESANISPEEEQNLINESKILQNQERIIEAITVAYKILYEDEINISNGLIDVIRTLSGIEEFDRDIKQIKEKLEAINYNLEDIIYFLRDYKSKYDFSPERLNEIMARLEVINSLKRKYGKTVEEVLKYKEECKAELNKIEHSEEEIKRISSEIRELEKEINTQAKKLSGKRKVVAKLLEEKVMNELKLLGMEKAKFKVKIEWIEEPNSCVEIEGKRYRVNEKGIDHIEFLISTNPDEPLKPLRKIVSGGELSRIMLALKTILAEVDNVDTLIFDEIDVGIGGKTADMVGKKMKELGKKKQIISITHQPQIARYGNNHIVVEKAIVDNKTIVKVKNVTGEERVKEIARMLGDTGEISLKHARELLIKA